MQTIGTCSSALATPISMPRCCCGGGGEGDGLVVARLRPPVEEDGDGEREPLRSLVLRLLRGGCWKS